MKARMEVTLDTIWTNQVSVSVECELDNPHTLTAQMLSELMVQRLKVMAEEVRHANERSAAEMMTGERRDGPDHGTGEPERERRAWEDLRADRDHRQSMFTERREERSHEHRTQ